MKFVAVLLVIYVGVVSGDLNPHHLCDEILTVPCSTSYVPGEKDERVCGTDGVTYTDFCLYAQARCKTPSVNIAWVGPCHAATAAVTATTTAATAIATATSSMPVHTGSSKAPVFTSSTTARNTATTQAASVTVDPIRQVFCATKDSLQCGTDLQPVCGSDKNFYLNKCEFSKGLCDDSALVEQPISFCQ